MKYYGLHFTTGDGTPMQVRIEAGTQRAFARYCPKGGEWTAWRRLDVERKADGALRETVEKAVSATSADSAKRLARGVNLRLQGAVSGSGKFDGSTDVVIDTDLSDDSGIADINKAIKALDEKVSALCGGGDDNAETRLATLERRQNNIIDKVKELDRHINGGDTVWDPDYVQPPYE